MMRKKIIKQGIIVLILLCFLFVISVDLAVSDKTKSIIPNVSVLSADIMVEYDDSIIQKGNDFIVPSNTSITIKNQENYLKITPPKGTDIIDYSDVTVDVVFEDFELKTINISESEKLFIPLNFIASVKGLNHFSLIIDYNEHLSDSKFKQTITNYSIDWGDGDVISGEGIIPSIIDHTYKETGTYLVTVSITDENYVTYSYLRNQGYKLSTNQVVTFWTVEHKDPIIIGSTSMISCFFVIGLALSDTSRYKLLALLTLAFPMTIYSNKEDVLDQFVRGQIYGYIKTNPGAYYNQIMRELEIKNGTLSYHLYVLEKTGLIKSRKEGYRYRVFYPTDMKFPEEERNRLTELQIKLLALIKEHEGASQKQLTKLLNEKHQTISYNIRVLKEAGLIEVNKKGRKTLCYIAQNPSNLVVQSTVSTQ
jgi:predicted transcriptional regulator